MPFFKSWRETLEASARSSLSDADFAAAWTAGSLATAEVALAAADAEIASPEAPFPSPDAAITSPHPLPFP